MSDSALPDPQHRFHVKVGLAECTVVCGHEDEAVRLARRHLKQEMPQLRGVIDGILDKEFRIHRMG